MTNREIANELSRRKMGSLEGRNDIFELNTAAKISLAGMRPGTREGDYLAMRGRAWFDLTTGTWHTRAPSTKLVHEDTSTAMMERIIWAAEALVAELGG